MAKLPNDIRSACRRTRRNRNRFPEVLAFLAAGLQAKLRAFSGAMLDDAAQVASLAVWRALKRPEFDPTRTNRAVQSFLMIAAERALLTFGRSISRYDKRADLVGDDVWSSIAAAVPVGMNGHAGFLRAYAVYYAHH